MAYVRPEGKHTRRTVARALDVSESTARRRMLDGSIPGVRSTPGGQLRVNDAAFREYLASLGYDADKVLARALGRDEPDEDLDDAA